MRGCGKWQAGIVLGLLCLPLAVQAEDAATLPPIQPGSAVEQDRPGRLKFRRGPTCMCATGTSEAEIRQAEEQRRAAAAAAEQQTPGEPPVTR